MWQTKQLLLHGAVILLIGFACGAPMGRSIVRGRPEAVVRAWRVAHSSLVAGRGRAALLNKVVYLGYILGVAGFLVGGAILLWGAYAAL